MIPNRFQSQCAANTTARYTQRRLYRSSEQLQYTKRAKLTRLTESQCCGRQSEYQTESQLFLAVFGNYWVLALDPEYRWAVAGEPSANMAGYWHVISNCLSKTGKSLGSDNFRRLSDQPVPQTNSADNLKNVQTRDKHSLTMR
jgi:hypothetical protein